MVDTSAAIRPSPARHPPDTASASRGWRAEIVTGGACAAAYADACRATTQPPPQGAAWVAAWMAGDPDGDHLAAILRHDGHPVLALALECRPAGPFRLARFVGGGHANGNFPAFDPAFAPQLTPPTIAVLAQAIAAARPDIDMLALERQLPDFRGNANPLAALSHCASANIALAADLVGGFDGLLGRVGGKRRRKRHRQQIRRLEAAGGYRRFAAESREQADALFETFLELKHARLTKAGLADVFADEATRSAWRTLFRQAAGRERPPFVLHGLEVGGTVRAVTGSSICGDRIVCEFSAIADDELSYLGPGDFLLFENVQDACQQGFAVYDLSVGDEHYKRMWCEIETRHFDVFAPLSTRGRLLASWRFASAAAKRTAKAHPAIRNVVAKLRAGIRKAG